MNLFLDSGAYSAKTRGKIIDIDKYISFIYENKTAISVYAGLDVIGDSKKTWENQIIMERAGLHPLPTFHGGEDVRWLKRYIDKGYEYICLGGIVGMNTTKLKTWLDPLFNKYLIDMNGMPRVKTHGFGIANIELILRYPWYSVDSHAWQLRGSRYGKIDIPTNTRCETKQDYMIMSLPISKGVRTYTKKNTGNSFGLSLPAFSQFDVSFMKTPTMKKNVEKLLSKYKLDLQTLSDDSRMRSVWNAIYLITTIQKFSNCIIYLSTIDLKIIKMLYDKFIDCKINLQLINVLMSFALLGERSNKLNNLIQLKKTYENTNK
jgi:hypothetical protein